jgi:hypothetical protein
MKKITIRKAGSVRRTSRANTVYGDPITCPWW